MTFGAGAIASGVRADALQAYLAFFAYDEDVLVQRLHRRMLHDRHRGDVHGRNADDDVRTSPERDAVRFHADVAARSLLNRRADAPAIIIDDDRDVVILDLMLDGAAGCTELIRDDADVVVRHDVAVDPLA
ncbi:MAG: hypothetical protein M5U28_22220 [Sandaracinaceae bacterium]|nr:hypothetical protein [Sandaracinaceae bacterium]